VACIERWIASLPLAMTKRVIAGHDPAIPLGRALNQIDRDGRDIGERSDAVLRTAIPAMTRERKCNNGYLIRCISAWTTGSSPVVTK
jgi:hypothetical protein